jgi:PAS domain S-box-containing protein
MDRLDDIRKRTDVPIVVANHEGFVTEINSRFTIVFGWEELDIIGKPLTTILPESFGDAHNLGFSRFQSTEIATVLNHPLELMTITKDNQEILTEHYITAEKVNEEWLFAAVLRPLV